MGWRGCIRRRARRRCGGWRGGRRGGIGMGWGMGRRSSRRVGWSSRRRVGWSSRRRVGWSSRRRVRWRGRRRVRRRGRRRWRRLHWRGGDQLRPGADAPAVDGAEPELVRRSVVQRRYRVHGGRGAGEGDYRRPLAGAGFAVIQLVPGDGRIVRVIPAQDYLPVAGGGPQVAQLARRGYRRGRVGRGAGWRRCRRGRRRHGEPHCYAFQYLVIVPVFQPEQQVADPGQVTAQPRVRSQWSRFRNRTTHLLTIGVVGKEVAVQVIAGRIGYHAKAEPAVPRRRYVIAVPGRHGGAPAPGSASLDDGIDIHIPVSHFYDVWVCLRPVAAGDGQLALIGRRRRRGRRGSSRRIRRGVGRRRRVGWCVGRRRRWRVGRRGGRRWRIRWRCGRRRGGRRPGCGWRRRRCQYRHVETHLYAGQFLIVPVFQPEQQITDPGQVADRQVIRRPFPVFLILTQLIVIGIVGKEMRVYFMTGGSGYYSCAKRPVPRRRYVMAEPGCGGCAAAIAGVIKTTGYIHLPVVRLYDAGGQLRPGAGHRQLLRAGRGPRRRGLDGGCPAAAASIVDRLKLELVLVAKVQPGYRVHGSVGIGAGDCGGLPASAGFALPQLVAGDGVVVRVLPTQGYLPIAGRSPQVGRPGRQRHRRVGRRRRIRRRVGWRWRRRVGWRRRRRIRRRGGRRCRRRQQIQQRYRHIEPHRYDGYIQSIFPVFHPQQQITDLGQVVH